MVTSDTLHEGDLILEGGVTLLVKNCVYNVTGSTILWDNSRLLITNATIRTVLFEMFDLSQLKAVSSELGGGVKAHDYSSIAIVSSTFSPSTVPREIELNQASSLELLNSTSPNILIIGNHNSDIDISASGPGISIRTGADQCHVEVADSAIDELHISGWSEVGAVRTVFKYVTLTHGGTFNAESCAILNSFSSLDYRSHAQLSNSWISTLIDGLKYEDMEANLSGDDIFREGHSTVVWLENSTVFETRYVLYLLGEAGVYRLDNLTRRVMGVYLDSSNVTAASIDNGGLVFYTRGAAVLRVTDSRFGGIISESASQLGVDGCTLGEIDFTGEIVGRLELVNSTLVSEAGPALRGGWLTSASLNTSVIRSASPSIPDIYVEYMNSVVLEDVRGVSIAGRMTVELRVYDSDVRLSGIAVEHLHNERGASSVAFVDGASCSRLTTLPAELVVEGLTVQPARAAPGEGVSVSATVRNAGEVGGSGTFALTLDGEEVGETEIILEGLSLRRVSFSLSPEGVGEHVVGFGDEEIVFTISGKNTPDGAISVYALGFAALAIAGAIVIFFAKRKA